MTCKHENVEEHDIVDVDGGYATAAAVCPDCGAEVNATFTNCGDSWERISDWEAV